MADRLVDNRRTVTERKMLMTFKAGMHASPGFDDNAKYMPALMENVDIDEDGRLVVRKGYRESELDASGSGEKLGIFHHVGIVNPVTRTRLLPSDSEWVRANRRVFILNPSNEEHKWLDIEDNIEFDWNFPKPSALPTVEIAFTDTTMDTATDASVYRHVSDLTILPNPFVAEGTVSFTVLSTVSLRLNVTRGNGEHIKTLLGDTDSDAPNGGAVEVTSGIKSYTWDGRNDLGERSSLDQYFVELLYLRSDGELRQIRSARAVYLGEPVPGQSEEEQRATFVGDVSGISEPEDNGDLVTGTDFIGFRGGTYAICYTYASNEYGIESAPSPVVKYYISAFPIQNADTDDPADENLGRADVVLVLGIDNLSEDMPTWADSVKFYGHRGRFPESQIDANELPFAFSYIGFAGRSDLQMPIPILDMDFDNSYFKWQNEHYIRPRQTLPSKDFNTNPLYNGFRHITLHAGRIWAYDRRINMIRVSLIDGFGVNRYDVFPHEDTALPHSFSLEGAWQSLPHRIIQMPDEGGIYVFYRDAIRTIRGKTILSGMFSPEIGPRTDLDASGGMIGIGSISRHAIVDTGNWVFFLGSDRRAYAIGPNMPMDSSFSRPILRHLKEISDNDLSLAFAERYGTKIYLNIGSTVYVYDMEYRYWIASRYPFRLTDFVWSRGGVSDESTFYGLASDNTIYQLETEDETDDMEWSITSNWREVPKNTVIKHIFFQHDTPDRPELKVRFDKDGVDGNEFDFTPEQKNLFRTGVNSSHIKKRFRIKVSGTGVPPNMSMVEYE